MGIDSYKGQKYEQIKKQLTKTGVLFHDTEFPPIQKSLFHSRTDEEILWKRPTDLCNVPKFIIDGASCEDLIEGELGNRWLVAAFSSLTNQPELFKKVVVNAGTQEFNMSSYCGMFRFQFWVYGKWTEVVIDDFLPTRHGKLVFCHFNSKNEFWTALLEKAYAKLFGDYESLASGCAVDALVDFTGGVAERCDISEDDGQDSSSCFITYKTLEKAVQTKSYVVAEVRVKEEATLEEKETTNDVPEGTDMLVLDSPTKTSAPSTMQSRGATGAAPKTGYFRSSSIDRDGYAMECGLLKSHGYNVREVLTISLRKEQFQLVRIQSPWQTGEWRGAWSNISPEMKNLSVKEKRKLGLKYESESEFWMLISDFLANFTHYDICHTINDTSIQAVFLGQTWNETLISGEWTQADFKDKRGGNMSHPTFLMNPQYMFDVSDTMNGAVMISLDQHDRTVHRVGRKESKHLCIGFTLMKVEENRKYKLHKPGDIVATSDFTNDRSVFGRSAMNKGRYVVVPSTKEPKFEGEFLLRIYNSSNNEVRELIDDEPKAGMCSSGYSMAVQLTVLGAKKLVVEKGTPNPYCIVKCEGDTQRTAVIKDCSSPEWNTKFIFYKKTTEGHKKFPITIQVYSSKTVGSTSLGEAVLKDFSDESGKTMELCLYQYSKKKDQPDIMMSGSLQIRVCSSPDLSEF